MKHFITTLLLGAALATPAAAKTPPDVLKPYKAYMAAFKAGDSDLALKHARKAYDQAIKLIPDDDVMPALAENYGDLLQATDLDEAYKVYQVALDAIPEDGTEDSERRADLMLKAAKTFLYRNEIMRRDVKRADYYFAKTRKYIDANDLTNTTLGAEAMVMEAWADARLGRRDVALKKLERADAIFEGPDHTLFSALEYQGKLIAGSILNREKKPIEAALVLQDVMQNLEGELEAEHPFIEDAFGKWMEARGRIALDDKVEEALAAGVCKCWPYDEMATDAPQPMVRIPPFVPQNIRQSGHVTVKFDVNEKGKPINVVATGYTNRKLVKPAVRAVESWQYEVRDDLDPASRKGIATQITFRLLDERGNLYPEEPYRKASNVH